MILAALIISIPFSLFIIYKIIVYIIEERRFWKLLDKKLEEMNEKLSSSVSEDVIQRIIEYSKKSNAHK